MEQKKYSQHEDITLILKDDGGVDELYKAAAERNIRHSLSLNHTERFKLMTKLMRMNIMLSQAKITHKKMP
jgi:hypothetical protein